MIKIALVFVVFIALLPTHESSPVDLQPMDVLTMWRLGDYTVLCDFFCGDYDDDDDEHDGDGAKTYLKYVEKSGVNPRIFCSICEDKKKTTTPKTTTSSTSTTAASTTAGTTASTTEASTAATT